MVGSTTGGQTAVQVTVVEAETEPEADEMERPRRLRPLLWRLHFFGGFFAAPIAVWLAITGILFAWSPQIESTLHDDKLTTSSEGESLPLSEQVEAVREAHPDSQVIDITPASGAGKTTGVSLAPAGAEMPPFGAPPGASTVYVDPVTAEVTGQIEEADRPDEWIRTLHSSFRQGDGLANNLTEVSASWVLLSLLTGIYLWWPKSKQALKQSVVPRVRGLRNGRRKPWRDLHSTVGILTLVVLAVVVVTGLTWTEYAGARVDTVKETLDTESPSLSTSLGEAAADGDDAHGEHGGSADDAADPGLDVAALDRVDRAAVASDVDTPYTITPAGPGEAWTVGELDDRWPLRQAEIAVDPASGDVVDRLEFGDKPLLDQATSLGIGFHEGTLFGLFNQALLTVMALGLVVMIVAGYTAWWRRRPKGAFAAPAKPGPLLRSTPIPLLLGFAVLLWFLPALAVSFVIYLVLERIVWLLRRRTASAV